jgi:hypothetical protein
VTGRTGFVVFPVLVELNRSYPFRGVYDLVEGFARRIGYPTFGLLPAFLGQNAPDLWVSPDNQHPNARAHAIVAKALLPFVHQLVEGVDERRGRVTADHHEGRGREQHKKDRNDPPALVASHLSDEFPEKTQAVPAVIRANPRG